MITANSCRRLSRRARSSPPSGEDRGPGPEMLQAALEALKAGVSAAKIVVTPALSDQPGGFRVRSLRWPALCRLGSSTGKTRLGRALRSCRSMRS